MKFLIFISLLFLACAPRYNIKKFEPIPEPTPVFDVEDDQSILFCVSFSGGGSRSAAMSWDALEYLSKIPYKFTNKIDGRDTIINTNLARQIDYISGISGGSFAAAGWCVYKDSMDLFKKRFVEKNVQRKLVSLLLENPINACRVLFSRSYTRTDVASEWYDNKIFCKKTLRDIPQRPVLYIHSTNLSLAYKMVYNQEYFDLLNSDSRFYPLGFACASSSAFPVLLAPMTLRNYSQSDSLKDIKYVMAKKNSGADVDAYYYCKMREFMNNRDNQWVHVADGGLVDNQGLEVYLDGFRTNGFINKRINNDIPLKKLIILNVNAGKFQTDESCTKQKSPNAVEVLGYTTVISMDRLSFERWKQVKYKADELWKAASFSFSSENIEKPYCIEVSFRNLEDDTLKKACMALPTSFYMNPAQLKTIETAVKVLLDGNAEMVRLKTSIK